MTRYLCVICPECASKVEHHCDHSIKKELIDLYAWTPETVHPDVYKAIVKAPLGAMLRRFVVNAPDTKVAFDRGVDAAKASPPAEHYFVVVFQGGLDTRITWPACWIGTYTVPQWEQIRDAFGGLSQVQAYVADHCRIAKGLAPRYMDRV